MAKTIFFTCLIWIALATGASYAYTVNVTNEMNQNDGLGIQFYVDGAGFYYFKSHLIKPGETWEHQFKGITIGGCFQKFKARVKKELPGCEAGNIADKWFEKSGTWCENVDVKVYRDGCNLSIQIQRRGW